MTRAAVVILNWNGCQHLEKFLPSVVRHTPAWAKVIVADNGSTDSSVEFITSHYPTVEIIRLAQNYGFAGGYNKALEKVSSEYLVLLNSDVEVTEGWLEPLVATLSDNPNVGAIAPKIRSFCEPEKFEYAGAAGGYMDKFGYPFCRGRIFDVVEKDYGQYDTIQPIFWATGAALFIRLKDYREAGGLDARFFAHMEEIDLCWRLRSRGRKLVCIPQSVVYHVGAATLKKENPRKTFLNFRNNLLMLYKNLPEKELNKVLWIRGLLDIVAMVVFFLKGEKQNAKAVLQARKEFKQLRPSFEASRIDNLRHAVMDQVPGKCSFSILWKFHVCGAKYFSKLAKIMP